MSMLLESPLSAGNHRLVSLCPHTSPVPAQHEVVRHVPTWTHHSAISQLTSLLSFTTSGFIHHRSQ
jgi:hypothetical protein